MLKMTTTQSLHMFLSALQWQNYSSKTIPAYGDDLTQFLAWVQKNPHSIGLSGRQSSIFC